MEDQTAIMPYTQSKASTAPPSENQRSQNKQKLENQEKHDTNELLRIKTGILNQAIRRPHNVDLWSSSIESRVVNTLIRFKNPRLPRQGKIGAND